MKFLICSDIHGSAHFCRLLVEKIMQENADRVIILGDILYHGPRNDLPKGYEPKEVILMLNESDAIKINAGSKRILFLFINIGISLFDRS